MIDHIAAVLTHLHHHPNHLHTIILFDTHVTWCYMQSFQFSDVLSISSHFGHQNHAASPNAVPNPNPHTNLSNRFGGFNADEEACTCPPETVQEFRLYDSDSVYSPSWIHSGWSAWGKHYEKAGTTVKHSKIFFGVTACYCNDFLLWSFTGEGHGRAKKEIQ